MTSRNRYRVKYEEGKGYYAEVCESVDYRGRLMGFWGTLGYYDDGFTTNKGNITSDTLLSSREVFETEDLAKDFCKKHHEQCVEDEERVPTVTYTEEWTYD